MQQHEKESKALRNDSHENQVNTEQMEYEQDINREEEWAGDEEDGMHDSHPPTMNRTQSPRALEHDLAAFFPEEQNTQIYQYIGSSNADLDDSTISNSHCEEQLTNIEQDVTTKQELEEIINASLMKQQHHLEQLLGKLELRLEQQRKTENEQQTERKKFEETMLRKIENLERCLFTKAKPHENMTEIANSIEHAAMSDIVGRIQQFQALTESQSKLQKINHIEQQMRENVSNVTATNDHLQHIRTKTEEIQKLLVKQERNTETKTENQQQTNKQILSQITKLQRTVQEKCDEIKVSLEKQRGCFKILDSSKIPSFSLQECDKRIDALSKIIEELRQESMRKTQQTHKQLQNIYQSINQHNENHNKVETMMKVSNEEITALLTKNQKQKEAEMMQARSMIVKHISKAMEGKTTELIDGISRTVQRELNEFKSVQERTQYELDESINQCKQTFIDSLISNETQSSILTKVMKCVAEKVGEIKSDADTKHNEIVVQQRQMSLDIKEHWLLLKNSTDQLEKLLSLVNEQMDSNHKIAKSVFGQITCDVQSVIVQQNERNQVQMERITKRELNKMKSSEDSRHHDLMLQQQNIQDSVKFQLEEMVKHTETLKKLQDKICEHMNDTMKRNLNLQTGCSSVGTHNETVSVPNSLIPPSPIVNDGFNQEENLQPTSAMTNSIHEQKLYPYSQSFSLNNPRRSNVAMQPVICEQGPNSAEKEKLNPSVSPSDSSGISPSIPGLNDAQRQQQQNHQEAAGTTSRTFLLLRWLFPGVLVATIAWIFVEIDAVPKMNQFMNDVSEYRQRTLFCDSGSTQIASMDGVKVKYECEQCPKNAARCSHGGVLCDTNYILRDNNCVLDAALVKFAFEIKTQAINILSERRGKYECGEIDIDEYTMNEDELLSNVDISDAAKKHEAFLYFKDNVLPDEALIGINNRGKYFSYKYPVCKITEWSRLNVLFPVATVCVVVFLSVMYCNSLKRQKKNDYLETMANEIHKMLQQYCDFDENLHVPVNIVRERMRPKSDSNQMWTEVENRIHRDSRVTKSVRMIDGMQRKCWKLCKTQ